MSRVVVDIITVGIIVTLYLFLFWVARSMRAHLARPADKAAPRHLAVLGPEGDPIESVSLERPVIIGRSAEADLVIDDPYASDLHARLGSAEGGFRIHDLGSTNGTYVNEQRIAAPVAVGPGDRIRIGQTIMGIR